MNKTTVNHSAITIGNNNIVNFQSDPSFIDWDLLKKSLLEVVRRLPEQTQEYSASTEALEYVYTKNRGGLKLFVQKHAADFTTSLFSSTASVFLIDFIKSLL